MVHSKVTLSLPSETLEAARDAAAATSTPFSNYVARALRNETLRRQVAAMSAVGELDLDTEWIGLAEADAAASR